MNKYSQKTFIFNVVSLTPFLTSSFVARQTKFLPLSCLVGVNNNVDVVTLPSGDVYELIIRKTTRKICKNINNTHVISRLRIIFRGENKINLLSTVERRAPFRSSTKWLPMAVGSLLLDIQPHIAYRRIKADCWIRFQLLTVALRKEKQEESYVTCRTTCVGH